MQNLSICPSIRRLFRLVKQGASWLCLFVLTLLVCAGAQAQPDTTRPAIMLNGADGTTTFTSLPSPLRGSAFDVGGMGPLAVSLWRNYSVNGKAESWNGVSWVSGAHAWNATLAAPDADHTSVWSANIPWPSGADLPNGRYEFVVVSYDSAGNRTDIVRSILIGPPDTTPPALAITTPANNTLLDSAQESLSSVSGTVNDGSGSGVAYVLVQISRVWEGVATSQIESWDGTSWAFGSNWCYFPATIGAPDAAGVRTWNLTAPLPPRAQLTTGQ